MESHDSALEEKPSDSDKLREVFDRAIRRFNDTVEPQLPMRELALAARRFVSIPGAMWEGPWGEQFSRSIRVEIPKIKRALRKIKTDYRENRIVPDFRPSGGESDQDTANTLDGLHRADSAYFSSQEARDNAFNEAVDGGFGAYRLTNEYDDPYNRDNDAQRVNPGMVIVDADQRVFFDLNSKRYDKRDARFAFVLTFMTRDAFEEEYEDACYHDFDDGISDRRWFDWFRPDGIRIAEYYVVEEVRQKVLVLTLPLTGDEERYWRDEIGDDLLEQRRIEGWAVAEQRRIRKRVRKYIMSGGEILKDCGHIAGDRIPVVPVYGERSFVDDQERFEGYVQSRMDAQRLYNAKASKLAELDTLAPRETPIFDPEQMPPELAKMWSDANIERYPFLLANALRAEDGSIVQMGPLGYVKPPDVPAVTAAVLQIANDDLIEDSQDGAAEVRANTSADAMDIAAARVDAKSGIFLDNMRQSVQCEGEIYLGMAAEVYVEPGRVVETMDEDGGDGTAILFEAYTDKRGAHLIRNDFSRGRYKVVSSVTEATATRRDKTVRRCLGMAETAVAAQDMELAQVMLSTAVMNTDGEGIGDVQAWVRKRLLSLGAVEPNEDEKRAMEQAAEQQQPDPAAILMEKQGQALEADALEKQARAGNLDADTKLKGAKTVETLANAAQKGAEAEAARMMPRIAFGRDLPANDTSPRPQISA